MATSKSKKPKLKSGRPPNVHKHQASLSRKATSTTIRSYHQLSKDLARAEAEGQNERAAEIKQRLTSLGGLKFYQAASIQGQSNDRGGDSSILLMEWHTDLKPELTKLGSKPRLLEIGALSTTNACSKSGLFDITRIDLHSQAEGITEQDFMERPLPTTTAERFDVISMSLVLNFVPTPLDRGKMLRRTCQFLAKVRTLNLPPAAALYFPTLFLVLPAACVANSRFMSEPHLNLIMASLGYVLHLRKQTTKLVYYLWILQDSPEPKAFPKKEMNSGHDRNNFSIVLEA